SGAPLRTRALYVAMSRAAQPPTPFQHANRRAYPDPQTTRSRAPPTAAENATSCAQSVHTVASPTNLVVASLAPSLGCQIPGQTAVVRRIHTRQPGTAPALLRHEESDDVEAVRHLNAGERDAIEQRLRSRLV